MREALKFGPFVVLLLIVTLVSCKDEPAPVVTIPDYIATPYDIVVPMGFPRPSSPDDNLTTVEGVELGRHLFFDKRLSADNSMACASCHLPRFAFTDQLAVSTGIDGVAGTKSAMSLMDIGFTFSGLFWDGRVMTLEEQALMPVEDPIEMHNTWVDVLEMVAEDDTYPELFRKAFNIKDPTQITKEDAAKAMAQYERAIVSSGEAKYDKVLQGKDIFTDQELVGFDLFFDDADPLIPDGECGHCHNAPTFTSDEFFNNGLQLALTLDDFEDIGHGAVSGNNVDYGKFRATTLRNIEFTAPYMHDGRFATLEEVMDHYASGGHFSPTRDPLMSQLATAVISEEHKQALIAFLKTLSDPDLEENPLFLDPF